MTSAQPVITRDTLNFTPDNLQCYAYSGVGSVTSSTDFTGIDFTTNSEFIKGRVYFSMDNDDVASGNQIGWKLMMNSQQLTISRVEASATDILDVALIAYFDVIIPPFTNFQAIAFTNASGVNCNFIFTGYAFGMIKTEYQ